MALTLVSVPFTLIVSVDFDKYSSFKDASNALSNPSFKALLLDVSVWNNFEYSSSLTGSLIYLSYNPAKYRYNESLFP